MKHEIWRWLPNAVKKYYLDMEPFCVGLWNKKNTEAVFTDIYQNNCWGKVDDGYFSGIGSANEFIVSNYVTKIREEADIRGFKDSIFIDLGCGDFRVGQQLVSLSSRYIAVDVVKPLIEYNVLTYSSDKVEFHHLDIIEDILPVGEVCFIRQVLQHLSNQQIKNLLEKLDQYTWVYITEHLPYQQDKIRPNINKVTDGKIRLSNQSGVYLSEPPFNVPAEKLITVLEVPALGIEEDYSAGVLRTFLYMPNI